MKRLLLAIRYRIAGHHVFKVTNREQEKVRPLFSPFSIGVSYGTLKALKAPLGSYIVVGKVPFDNAQKYLAAPYSPDFYREGEDHTWSRSYPAVCNGWKKKIFGTTDITEAYVKIF